MKKRSKVAVITGGARIGAAVATQLSKRGYDIILTYRTSKSAVTKTAKQIKKENQKAHLVKTDLTHIQSIKNLTALVKREYGGVDVLVNMASIYVETPFTKLTNNHWTENQATNLNSAYHVSLELSSYLKKRKGRIINFSDWVSASGRPRYKSFLPYYVAKTGIIGLTEALALELAPEVLVNAIAPGPILPPKGLSNEETRGVEKVTPLKKWGGAQEIVKAVLFLVDTGFVTGEVIRVDGGRHLI